MTAAPTTTVTVTETAATPPTVTVTVPGSPWARVPEAGAYQQGAYPSGVYQPGAYQQGAYPSGTTQQAQPFDVSGWRSGASGKSAIDGSFGSWRGKPVQVIAIWGDTTAEEQTEISALGAVDGFDGDLDVAVGALAEGESWERAAQGAYADRWRQAAKTIAAHRSGKPGTTYVRFAHELNGSWFDWKVTSGNLAAFKTAWRLYHDILAQEYPAAKLVFSPNNGSHSDVPVSDIYPGDELVDVIGVDFYDGWPSVTSQEDWDKVLYATEKGDQPRGVGAWQRFAAAHGKPLSFPEWGLQKGDHPAFIKAMHEFLSANAARPGDVAGKVVYDVYFDIAHGGNKGFMLTGSANPQSAQLYRSLQWGS